MPLPLHVRQTQQDMERLTAHLVPGLMQSGDCGNSPIWHDHDRIRAECQDYQA